MHRSVGSPAPTHRGTGKPTAAYSLDDKTRTLVCLGALIATAAGPTAYERPVEEALAAGATTEEVIATLMAVASTVGLAHLVSATAGLAHGLGYDIDAALESLDVPPEGT